MLKGQTVLLRPMRREDLPKLNEFNNDVEVELAGGGDPPMPQTLARLEASFDQEVAKGGRDGSSFAIETDNKFIGQCALFRFNAVAQTAELGITIGDKASWGLGYGREAIKLLLDYGFRLHNLRKIYLTVNGNNERAIRVYTACGFIEEARWRAHVWSNGQYIDLVGMGILRNEWNGKVGTTPKGGLTSADK